MDYFDSALVEGQESLPADPLLRLLKLLRLEALVRPYAVEEADARLACSRMKDVLAALFRSLRTGNPSGEPANEEARRGTADWAGAGGGSGGGGARDAVHQELEEAVEEAVEAAEAAEAVASAMRVDVDGTGAS